MASIGETARMAWGLLRDMDLDTEMGSELVFDWRGRALLVLLINARAKEVSEGGPEQRLLYWWKEQILADVLADANAKWWARPHTIPGTTSDSTMAVFVETGDADIGQLAFHVNPTLPRLRALLQSPTLEEVGRTWDRVQRLPIARQIARRWWQRKQLED